MRFKKNLKFAKWTATVAYIVLKTDNRSINGRHFINFQFYNFITFFQRTLKFSDVEGWKKYQLSTVKSTSVDRAATGHINSKRVHRCLAASSEISENSVVVLVGKTTSICKKKKPFSIEVHVNVTTANSLRKKISLWFIICSTYK